MEIYRGDQPLPITHHVSDNNGSVVVEQSRLDTELWLNGVLGAELKSRGLDYRSLIDYDLQLYEVRPATVHTSILVEDQVLSTGGWEPPLPPPPPPMLHLIICMKCTITLFSYPHKFHHFSCLIS